MNAIATTSIAGSQQVLGLSSSVAKRVSLTGIGQIMALTKLAAQKDAMGYRSSQSLSARLLCPVFAKPNTANTFSAETVSIHDANWKHARIIQGGNP